MAFLDCVDVHAIAKIGKFDVAEAVRAGAEIDENIVGFHACTPSTTTSKRSGRIKGL